MIGPSAKASELTAAHSPIARPRCSGGNASVTRVSESGSTQAAPTPITARAAITISGPLCEAAEDRAEPEGREAEEENAAAADDVAEPARRDDECGQHEQVGVRDPPELDRRRIEVSAQHRQRDVDDR